MAENNKKKKIVTIVLVVLIAVLAVLIIVQRTVGFGKKSSGFSGFSSGAGAQAQAVNVRVEKAVPAVFTKKVNFNGELSRNESSKNIGSDVAGTVVNVFVKRGDYVKAGDVVAQVDPSSPGSQYKVRDVVANVSGTVLSVDAYVGQKVNSGATLASVGNPSTLILKMNIPEKYLSAVHEGSRAYFTTAAWPEKEYSAVATYVGTSVSSSSRTVEYEFAIQDSDSKLLEGMYVKADVVVYENGSAITVPTTALTTYLDNDVLYIAQENGGKYTAKRVYVTKGVADDSRTEIISGLSSGDLVIVAGSVIEGSLINIVNPEEVGK